jgi:hypothetical protein
LTCGWLVPLPSVIFFELLLPAKLIIVGLRTYIFYGEFVLLSFASVIGALLYNKRMKVGPAPCPFNFEGDDKFGLFYIELYAPIPPPLI